MRNHVSARGNGSLLRGLDVAVVDRTAPTLCAAWWLTELGADVCAPPAPEPSTSSTASGALPSMAERRLSAHRPGPHTYVIRCAAHGEDLPGAGADALTLLTLVDPVAPAGRKLDGWSGAAAWARSAMASLTRSIRANPGEQRLRVPADDHAAFLAGSFGVVVLLAVEWAARAGRSRPSAIDVDLEEVLAAFIQQPVAAAQLGGGAPPAMAAPGGVKPAADGLVFVQPVEPAHWGRLIDKAGGVPGVTLSSPPPMSELIAHRDSIDHVLERWLSSRAVDALVDELQDEHIPAAPVSLPADMLADVHLSARAFFEAGRPTVPWTRAAGGGAQPTIGGWAERDGRRRPTSALPLDGLRVLDLTWAWAGPYATTILADLGAEVINIEWWPRPSNLRTQNPTVAPDSPDGCGWWSANQRGKLSVGVNLKSAEGVQVVRDLAAVSHLAVENFSAGVAERLGVGAGALQECNPALVYASLSAFGSHGPHEHWIGYGTQLLTASGMARAMIGGVTDDDVSLMGIPYPDPLSGLTGALALLASVGRGAARLDISMLEATCLAITTSITSHAGSGDRNWRPVFVECSDGATVLAALPGAEFTLPSTSSATSLIDAVRATGGDAVVVATPASVLEDDRLARRSFWRADQTPLLHRAGVLVAGPPFRVDGERPAWWRGAPNLFEDTAPVLRDVLGYEEQKIDSLAAHGAIAIGAGAQAPDRRGTRGIV